MGYCHMFYGVDLKRIQALFGSNDTAYVDELIAGMGDELKGNDAFFADAIDEGTCPASEQALRHIVAGTITGANAEAMYGYVLKIICEREGEMLNGEVYAIRDHPYASKLVASGPPIPIPDDAGDFPEIGYLALEDIDGEIERIDKAPQRARRSLALTVLKWATRGMLRLQMSDEEAVEDMAAYRESLIEAKKKGYSIVAFRH